MVILHDAMTLSISSGIPKHTAIGIGMWLGVIMAFNVWFVIWPNQKRALGIVECEPDLKAKSAKNSHVVFKNKYTYFLYQCCLRWLCSAKPLLKLLYFRYLLLDTVF